MFFLSLSVSLCVWIPLNKIYISEYQKQVNWTGYTISGKNMDNQWIRNVRGILIFIFMNLDFIGYLLTHSHLHHAVQNAANFEIHLYIFIVTTSTHHKYLLCDRALCMQKKAHTHTHRQHSTAQHNTIHREEITAINSFKGVNNWDYNNVIQKLVFSSCCGLVGDSMAYVCVYVL